MVNQKEYKIGCYIRVSTEEQAANPEGSIRNQHDRLMEMVKIKNQSGNFGEIVGIYTDEGLSGKDTKRPELQRLLRDILEQKIDMVMVSELSRISRNMKDFADIWELFKAKGCAFLSLRESFDTTTAAGEMVLFSLANLAQFERRQVSERVVANIKARAKRGLFNGGTVPLGYKLIPNKPGHLEIDEDAVDTVRMAFRTFLEKESLAPAAKWLNDNGWKIKRSKQGGGKWTRLDHFSIDNLHHILRNKAYAGIKTYKENGKECEAKAVWEAIIDGPTFDRAQKILSGNRYRKKPASSKRYPYQLSGITYCLECGGVMCGKSAYGRNGKVGYYEHSWATKRDATFTKKLLKHEPHRVAAVKLERIVLEEVKNFITKPSYVRGLLGLVQEKAKGDEFGKEKRRLISDIASLKGQLAALTERLSELPVSVSAAPFYEQMAVIEKKKEATSKRLLTLKSENLGQESPAELETIRAFSEGLKGIFESQGNEEIKARMIRRIVDRVEVGKDKVRVHFFVGEKHYKEELALASSVPLKILKNIGSNSLTNGAQEGT